MFAAIVPQSTSTAVGAASVQFASTLTINIRYAIVSTADAWIAQGANPTAVANTAGNALVPAATVVYVSGDNGAKVAIIQSALGGFASITPVF